MIVIRRTSSEESTPRRRQVALCLRSCVVSLEGGPIRLLGGEWITHEPHVVVVREAPGFRLFEVTDEELPQFQQEHAEEVKRLREQAAQLGLALYRDGEVQPPKRRR